MKKFIYLLIIIATTASAGAQQSINTVAVGEKVFLSANATTFVTGETLHCKIYALDQETRTASAISKIAYVELIDQEKKIVSKQKCYLENGAAHADIFIPTTLETGHYKLVAYTQWMLNVSASNFYQTDITVVNPFAAAKTDAATVFTKTSTETAAQTSNTSSASVKANKKTYAAREKAALQITADAGNYILSVRKTDNLFESPQVNSGNFMASLLQQQNSPNSGAVLPELRGEIVSGKIVSKTSGYAKNITVALSFKDKNFAVKLVRTDKEGKFNFILDHFPINSEAIIQVYDENRNDFSIELDNAKEPDFSNLVFPSEMNITAADKQSVEARSVASQIENAYYNRKKDSLQPMLPVLPFYNSLQKEYLLDDYTRFPTIRETITEILEEVGFTKNRRGYTIFVRNYYVETSAYGHPLVLIDGYPIQDLNELFDYPATALHKVDIINSPYIYGPKTFSGVISFTTKGNDFEPKTNFPFIKKIMLLRPSQQKSYFMPDYSEVDKNSSIPDYRHQLLWIPELEITSKTVEIPFFTSDVAGNFEVTLQGFSANGTAVFVKEFIEVR